jgi:hypothetical protein
MKQSKPYGTRDNGTAYCVNSNPGSFGHECSKPAKWIGKDAATGFEACYCDGCKAGGYEAKGQTFRPFSPAA